MTNRENSWENVQIREKSWEFVGEHENLTKGGGWICGNSWKFVGIHVKRGNSWEFVGNVKIVRIRGET